MRIDLKWFRYIYICIFQTKSPFKLAKRRFSIDDYGDNGLHRSENTKIRFMRMCVTRITNNVSRFGTGRETFSLQKEKKTIYAPLLSSPFSRIFVVFSPCAIICAPLKLPSHRLPCPAPFLTVKARGNAVNVAAFKLKAIYTRKICSNVDALPSRYCKYTMHDKLFDLLILLHPIFFSPPRSFVIAILWILGLIANFRRLSFFYFEGTILSLSLSLSRQFLLFEISIYTESRENRGYSIFSSRNLFLFE